MPNPTTLSHRLPQVKQLVARARVQRDEITKKDAELGSEKERAAQEKAELVRQQGEAVRERDALAAQLAAASEAAAKEKVELTQRAQKLASVGGWAAAVDDDDEACCCW